MKSRPTTPDDNVSPSKEAAFALPTDDDLGLLDDETPSTPLPQATPGSSALPSAGALLKEAREKAGLSIDDIARSLKLAPRQIQAIEEQDFASLPSRAFVRGFIRNYARQVNIDPEAVLAALPQEEPPSPSLAASSIKASMYAASVFSAYSERMIHPQTWKWLFATALLAFVAAAFFFWPQITALFPARDASQTTLSESTGTPPRSESAYTVTPVITTLSETPTDPATLPTTSPDTLSDTPRPTPDDTSATPESTATPTANATTTSTESGEAELAMRFSGDSWVEVRDGRGKVLYFALAKSGSEKTFHGVPPLSLVLGNSTVVTATFRGEKIDLSGHSKQGVVRLTLE